MGRAAPALLDVWIYFNLVANTILLPLLVATFLFSKRVTRRRDPTLINVCMTWILSGIFSLLLFYGGQASGPEPEKPLCIAQTALLYGITPMWSVAVLVLFWRMIHVMNEEPGAPPISRPKMIAMLCAPYVVQTAFSIAALVGSLVHPENVTRTRRFFYCALHLPPLAMTMTLFTAAMGVGISGLMVYLAVLLYRNWHGMRDAGRPSRVDGQIVLRIVIFGIYIFFGFVVNILDIVAPHNLAPDLYAATVGTVIFLVFGTQADVVRAWCFWLRDPADTRLETIYLPREPSWRYSLDLLKSAVPPLEELKEKAETGQKRDPERVWEKEMDKEKAERSIAWGERPNATPPDTPSTQV
ncbi:hypothetical protein B0H16DRAFT_1296716 [Mycena metata]|uniref:Uncharacterized protein n=1 Tax=Mycena metata TaxID=1033252 RepID=A0AAD7KFF2_9AGAR|nr:hypothetical protein B0H16DRAFT_1296716 [Mycena metata]